TPGECSAHRVTVHALFAGIRCSSADSTGAGEEAWLVRMSGWAESRSPKGSPLEFGFRNSVQHRFTTNGRFRSNLISVFLACLGTRFACSDVLSIVRESNNSLAS